MVKTSKVNRTQLNDILFPAFSAENRHKCHGPMLKQNRRLIYIITKWPFM